MTLNRGQSREHHGYRRAGHAGKQAPGHGGRPQAAERAGNFDHTCAAARQPAQQRLTRGENFTCAELAMTPVKCHSQPTQCAYIGLAGGSAPSTPGRRYGAAPRRFGPAVDAAVAGPLAGRSMSAGRPPASGSARSPAAVNPLARVLRLRFGPPGDRGGRPCGIAVAGQPEGWPSLKTTKRNAACRGSAGPATASAPRLSACRRQAAHRPQRTEHRRRRRVRRSPGRTARTTEARPAGWRRQTALSSGSRKSCRP